MGNSWRNFKNENKHSINIHKQICTTVKEEKICYFLERLIKITKKGNEQENVHRFNSKDHVCTSCKNVQEHLHCVDDQPLQTTIKIDGM